MKTFFSLLAVLCLSFPLFSQTNADEQAIHEVMQTLSEGWTNGSGEQFASVFADEHDFIVWNGLYNRGMNPKENAAGHQQIFDTMYKNTRLHYVVDKVKFIRDDIALAHVFGAVNSKSESRPKDPQVLWTALLEKQRGNWKIISFHNLDLELFENEEMKKSMPPAEAIYQSWYATPR